MRLGPPCGSRASSSISSSSTCRRPGRVDDQHVEARRRSPGRAPTRRSRPGRARCPARRPSRRPLADGDQLLDRRRALGVAGRERRPSCRSSPSSLASFAQAVVLPGALKARHQDHGRARPTRRRGRGSRRPSAPRAPRSTIFTTCWPGLRLSSTPAPEAALRDLRGELLHDLEVDVRLEQREADLPHRAVDVGLGQLAARADVARASPGGGRRAGRTQVRGQLTRRSTGLLGEQRGGELAGVERPQVLEPLAHPDQLHRDVRARPRSRARCRPSPCRRAWSARRP